MKSLKTDICVAGVVKHIMINTFHIGETKYFYKRRPWDTA